MSSNFHLLRLDPQVTDVVLELSAINRVDLNSVERLKDNVIRVGNMKTGRYIAIELHPLKPVVKLYGNFALVGFRKILIADSVE